MDEANLASAAVTIKPTVNADLRWGAYLSMVASRMRATPPQSADDFSARLVPCEMPMAQRSARTAKLDMLGVPGVWPSAGISFAK
jgi:hypothetical protein